MRCCGRWKKNVTSVPRWWGWLVVPGLWYLVYLIRDIYIKRNCVSLRAYLVRISNQPWLYIHRMICGLDGGWMSCCGCLHIKYTHKLWGLATLCCYFFSFLWWSIEGRPRCKFRCRLAVAAGGNLRFGCQYPASLRIRSRGHPFRIAAVNKKYSFEVFAQKERDSKPSADCGEYRDIFPWFSSVGNAYPEWSSLNVMLHFVGW